ncbi:hypothetical protein [Nonomuraea dietziae]|uniref:hypothetical protein n=1 Tax=Nonomuraea dietziae TaxID=65515 RepID=UPI0031D9341D
MKPPTARLETSATPIEPPSSWKVLTTPEATPASPCGTLAIVVAVAATKAGADAEGGQHEAGQQGGV